MDKEPQEVVMDLREDEEKIYIPARKRCKLCYGRGYYQHLEPSQVETRVIKRTRKSTLTEQVNKPIIKHCSCLDLELKKAVAKDKTLMKERKGIYTTLKDEWTNLSSMVVELVEDKVEVNDEKNEAATD